MSGKICCAAFAESAGNYQAPVGGGLYWPEVMPLAQFEIDDDGSWNINGCCGGGCYVVTNMRFCPYCGAAIAGEPKGKP